MPDPSPPAPTERAPTWRVLVATAYDGLLALALLLVVTAALLPLTHGEAISHARVGAWQYAYAAVQLGVIAVYFGIPWTRRGQTLAMKAWRMRLERTDGSLADWPTVLRRLAVSVPLYVTALAGLMAWKFHIVGPVVAALCVLPAVANHALQAITGRGTVADRVSGTRIVRVAKDV